MGKTIILTEGQFNDLKSVISEEVCDNRFFMADLFLEYYYGGRQQFIFERFSDRTILFEKYGVFPDCEKIAKEIIFRIERDNEPEFLVNVDNNWLGKIRVINDPSLEYSMGYSPNNTKEEGNIFDEITIYVNRLNYDGDNELGLLMHELTHAYQDYCLRKSTGKTLKQKLEDSGYFKNKTTANDNIDFVISKVFYYYNAFEESAYASSIDGYLKSVSENFSTVDDVMKLLSKTPVYSNYQELNKYVKFLIDVPEDYKWIVVYYANKRSGKVFKTYTQFIKWLTNKQYKINKKFSDTVRKIVYDNITMKTTLMPPDAEVLKRMPTN